MNVVVWILVAVVVVAALAFLLSRKPTLPAPKDEAPPGAGDASASPAELARGAAREGSGASAELVPQASAKASAVPEAAEAATGGAVGAGASGGPPSPAQRASTPPQSSERPRDLTALKRGLAQTRTGWMQRLFAVFTGKKEIDPALLEEIEETLLTGDVGSTTTRRLVDGLKERLDRKELADVERVWDALKADSLAILDVGATPFGGAAPGKPLVILMAGVNGAGKTTTIAKLATRYKEAGRSVLLAAGDTFRAAAVAQLEMWGSRIGVPVHKGKEGAKPGAVVYEAVKRGVDEGFEVVIADTAGRLQTKAPLMEELRKIREACAKASPGAPQEVLLVLDATTGQNAILQAEEFSKALALTGVVLTKLDGTAKGGVILAVAEAFKLPVRFIGVGEKSEDLREFDARDFVEALFARGDDEPAN